MVVNNVLLLDLVKMSNWDAIRVADSQMTCERIPVFDGCGQTIEVQVVIEAVFDEVSELLSLLEGPLFAADALRTHSRCRLTEFNAVR